LAESETETEDGYPSDELSESLPLKYKITSYGADYPVDGLVKRIISGDIKIPEFQRGYVWSLTKASSFVESLLLGLPVPGIFLSKEQDTEKLLVIDGQQRLTTLQYFYEGIFKPSGKEFVLRDVQAEFNGATYKTLGDEDRRRLDDSILHATIVKQDEPSEDDSSIYHVFERLNTGGSLLRPQEIRSAIYHGEFNQLLKELNTNKSWRAIFGNLDSRMRDQELILRFFALYYRGNKYKKPLREFLNLYMGANRHLKYQSAQELSGLFDQTITLVSNSLGNDAFKRYRVLNVAVFDSVTVGIARRLARGSIASPKSVKEKYSELLGNQEFVTATERTTTDEEMVKTRINLATKAFADIQ
jgi:hypothetical protein